MVYEVISSWVPDDQTATQPRGWYRDSSDRLRYWDGRSWADSQSLATTAPSVDTSRIESVSARLWRIVAMALGWIATIAFLGLALSSTHTARTNCGSIFSPVALANSHVQAACATALDSQAKATAVAAILALACFVSIRWPREHITRSRYRRTHWVTGCPGASR